MSQISESPTFHVILLRTIILFTITQVKKKPSKNWVCGLCQKMCTGSRQSNSNKVYLDKNSKIWSLMRGNTKYRLLLHFSFFFFISFLVKNILYAFYFYYVFQVHQENNVEKIVMDMDANFAHVETCDDAMRHWRREKNKYYYIIQKGICMSNQHFFLSSRHPRISVGMCEQRANQLIFCKKKTQPNSNKEGHQREE